MNWTEGKMPNQTITSTKNGKPIGYVVAEQPSWARIILKPDGVTFDLICDENLQKEYYYGIHLERMYIIYSVFIINSNCISSRL